MLEDDPFQMQANGGAVPEELIEAGFSQRESVTPLHSSDGLINCDKRGTNLLHMFPTTNIGVNGSITPPTPIFYLLFLLTEYSNYDVF